MFSMGLRLLDSTARTMRDAALGKSPLARAGFRLLYDSYKRALEDSLVSLLHAVPDLVANGHVVDVGGGVGYTAELFATRVTKGYSVAVFEPDPLNFLMIRDRFSRRGAPENVLVEHAAVGDLVGNAHLWRNPLHNCDNRLLTPQLRETLDLRGRSIEVATVKMTNIDSFLDSAPFTGPVALVKIDVQGAELLVCRGMSRLWNRQPRLRVLVEYAPAWMRGLGYKPEELLTYFGDHGFRLHEVRSGGYLPIFSPSDSTQLTRRGYTDLLAVRGHE